jgi:hypothetical protein
MSKRTEPPRFKIRSQKNYSGPTTSTKNIQDPAEFVNTKLFPEAVLLTQLLEDAGELAGGRLGLLLRVGTGARDLPRGPNGGRGVGVPQLHCHHPVLTP